MLRSALKSTRLLFEVIDCQRLEIAPSLPACLPACRPAHKSSSVSEAPTSTPQEEDKTQLPTPTTGSVKTNPNPNTTAHLDEIPHGHLPALLHRPLPGGLIQHHSLRGVRQSVRLVATRVLLLCFVGRTDGTDKKKSGRRVWVRGTKRQRTNKTTIKKKKEDARALVLFDIQDYFLDFEEDPN